MRTTRPIWTKREYSFFPTADFGAAIFYEGGEERALTEIHSNTPDFIAFVPFNYAWKTDNLKSPLQ